MQLQPVRVSDGLKRGVKFVKWDDVSGPAGLGAPREGPGTRPGGPGGSWETPRGSLYSHRSRSLGPTVPVFPCGVPRSSWKWQGVPRVALFFGGVPAPLGSSSTPKGPSSPGRCSRQVLPVRPSGVTPSPGPGALWKGQSAPGVAWQRFQEDPSRGKARFGEARGLPAGWRSPSYERVGIPKASLS